MIYTFKNEDTGEVRDIECPMSEISDITSVLEDEGWYRVWNVNLIAGRDRGLSRVDDGFTDILKDIKSKSGRECTIETK